jgi:hypothetical protein
MKGAGRVNLSECGAAGCGVERPERLKRLERPIPEKQKICDLRSFSRMLENLSKSQICRLSARDEEIRRLFRF